MHTFVNISTGATSQPFQNVSAWNRHKVVYAAQENGITKIIVQDIYDREKYYLEIIRDYSPGAKPHRILKEAEFLNDSQLKLTYYIGKRRKEVSEIINLPEEKALDNSAVKKQADMISL